MYVRDGDGAGLAEAVHGCPPLLFVLADHRQDFALAERQVVRILSKKTTFNTKINGKDEDAFR